MVLFRKPFQNNKGFRIDENFEYRTGLAAFARVIPILISALCTKNKWM